MKKILKYYILFICLSCAEKDGLREQTTLENESVENIKYEQVEFETLTLDTVETSFSGFFHIHNNTLRYLDRRFGWLFIFDSNGNFLRKEFGRGNGPKQIPSYDVSFYSIKNDSSYFFLGGSWDGYNYNVNNELQNRFQIEWLDPVSDQEVLQKRKDPTNSRMYSFDYDQDIVTKGNLIYVPLQSQYINFNLTHDDYFSEGRTLAKIDLRTGEMLDILGRRSKLYENNDRLRLKSSILLANHPKGIMYGFETDSTIYIMNDEEKIIDLLGLPGDEMNMSYPKLERTRLVDDMIQVGKAWNRSTRENGYYTSLKYFPSQNITMRTYQKGGDENTDGLQIYKNNILIGDLDVPNGFEIRGYLVPYFYSNIMSNDDELVLKTVRFKL